MIRDVVRPLQLCLYNWRFKVGESILTYFSSKRFDVQSLRNDKYFMDLNRDLQHIITCLAESRTELVTLVIQESTQTRQYIAARFDQLEEERLYRDVTQSLFYPDISSRQEQIEKEFDGIKDSYDWIFDESHKERRWSNFSEWLKSSNAVYWISGKAGSGKSTLMHYICNHPRKNELLKQWSAGRRLLTPTFFFWNAGSNQQKSIIGLLRSIIFQMLIECRELITCFKVGPNISHLIPQVLVVPL